MELSYSSISVKDKQERGIEYMAEYLNSTGIADLPLHDLNLMNNMIIMLLCNLDISGIVIE